MTDETLEDMIKDADVSPEAIDKALKPPESFAMWTEARESRPWYRTWTVGPVYVHRDSDALTRSNARMLEAAMRERFGKPGIRNGWEPQEASHWAVGWCKHLSVKVLDSKGRPTEQFRFVQAWFKYLDEVYPVASDDDFSAEEQEEADQVWRDCFDTKERVKYMREHRNQFDVGSLADLIGCVRGSYFAGYASELLN